MTQEQIRFVKEWCYSRANDKFITESENSISIILSKGVTEEGLNEEGMFGDWCKKAGFTVEYEVGDYEYKTNPERINGRGKAVSFMSGHKAFIRNRTKMTIHW